MRAYEEPTGCPRPRSFSPTVSAGAPIAPWPAGISGACSICSGRRLRQIEQQHLGAVDTLQRQRPLIADGGAVAGGEPLAVQIDRAPGHLDPGMPPGLELMRDALSLAEHRSVNGGVLVHLHRSFAPFPGSQQPQLSAPFLGRKARLLVTGLDSSPLRNGPDPQEVHRLLPRGVGLAVRNAGAGAR